VDILTAVLILTHFSDTSPTPTPKKKNIGAGSDDSCDDDHDQ